MEVGVRHPTALDEDAIEVVVKAVVVTTIVKIPIAGSHPDETTVSTFELTERIDDILDVIITVAEVGLTMIVGTVIIQTIETVEKDPIRLDKIGRRAVIDLIQKALLDQIAHQATD